MRHLIDPTDLTVAETEQIVALAEDIIAKSGRNTTGSAIRIGKSGDLSLLNASQPQPQKSATSDTSERSIHLAKGIEAW